jgi:plastocyanin
MPSDERRRPATARVRRGTLLVAATLLAGVGAAGCGSSGSRSSSSSSTTATATHPSGTTTANGGGLKVITTPKFASPSPTAPIQSGIVPIAYRNITIRPETVRVKAGSTIVWRSYDPVEHNVTSISGPQNFRSSNFGEGGTFRVRLRRPGVIHYECTNHPATMNGTIEVVK